MELTSEQIALLDSFHLPTDFADLSDEQFYAIDDKISHELMVHGVNDAGDGLNDYGNLCQSILEAMPDD